MRWIIIFLLLSIAVNAGDIIKSDSITLLAMLESESGKSGTVASLSLELRPGTERVFLETFPMTKITTQASLRFAQQVACSQVEADCSKYDFLYTIRALPGIVGGPSAGSSAAFLTAALLLNRTIPRDIAMTGTINSGGVVGPVGGLKYKIEAAAGNGIKTVYLPKGTKDVKDEDNATIDLIEYGKTLNLTVIEVATLGEALEKALGVPQNISNEPLKIEDRYQRIMHDVADDLCKRTAEFMSKPLKANLTQAKNFTARAMHAEEQGSYYAAASFCFRANVDYKRKWYQEQNFSKSELDKRISILKVEVDNIQKDVESKNITTLTDLQTFMVVMERITEAQDLLKAASEEDLNETEVAAGDIGYAEERLFSAFVWARFFNGQDQVVVLDKNALKLACSTKISEAEERYNYVKSVIPEALSDTRGDIDKAYDLLNNEKYIMCLYGAIKAKSEADVLLNLMGVDEKRFDEVIDLKLSITRQALIKAQNKHVFPIIAYSYYDYANSLRDFDRVSALLFAEYALELSNLDIYFQEKKHVKIESEKPAVNPQLAIGIFAFGIGFGIGGIVVWMFSIRSSSKKVQTLQAPRKRRLRGKKR